jgi:hypothetical protein
LIEWFLPVKENQMGCCVSSNKALISSVATLQPLKPSQTNGTNLQVEEEKVKEVLLETPKLNPKNTTKTEQPKPHRNIKAYDKVNQKKALSINKGHDSSETCRFRKKCKQLVEKKPAKGSTVLR